VTRTTTTSSASNATASPNSREPRIESLQDEVAERYGFDLRTTSTSSTAFAPPASRKSAARKLEN